MISFNLKEHEISLLHSVCWELDSMVDDLIAREVRQLVEKALMSGEISKTDLERLLKLLPQLEIMATESNNSEDDATDDDIDEDWPEWDESNKEKQKRRLRSFQQQLSNWLFTQYAIYQKQLSPKCAFNSPIRMSAIGKRVEKDF